MYINRYFLFLLFFYSNVVLASDWLGEGKMLGQFQDEQARKAKDEQAQKAKSKQARKAKSKQAQKEEDAEQALLTSQAKIKEQILAVSAKAYEKDSRLQSDVITSTIQDNVDSAQTAGSEVHPANLVDKQLAEAYCKRLDTDPYFKQVQEAIAAEKRRIDQTLYDEDNNLSASASNISLVHNPGFVDAHSPEAANLHRSGSVFDSGSLDLSDDFLDLDFPAKLDSLSLEEQADLLSKHSNLLSEKDEEDYSDDVDFPDKHYSPGNLLHQGPIKKVDSFMTAHSFRPGTKFVVQEDVMSEASDSDQKKQVVLLKTQLKQMQKQLEKVNQERSSLSTSLAAAEEQRKSLAVDLNKQADLIKSHKIIAGWTKITNRSQKVQSNVLRFIQNCKIAVLRKTLEGTKKQNEELQASEQSLRGKIGTLESEIATAQHARMVHAEETKQEIEKLKIQECSLSGRIEIEKEKKEKLEQELQRIIRIRDALKKEFIAFGEENKVLKSEKVNQDQKLDRILLTVGDLKKNNQEHLTRVDATLSTLRSNPTYQKMIAQQAVRDARAAGFKNG